MQNDRVETMVVIREYGSLLIPYIWISIQLRIGEESVETRRFLRDLTEPFLDLLQRETALS